MLPLILEFTATDTWTSLADLYDVDQSNDPGTTTYIGLSGILAAHADNGSPLEIRFGSSESELDAGQEIPLNGVNIANIEIKGDTLVLKALGASAKGW